MEEDQETSAFGCMAGTIKINGDIIAPTGEPFDVELDDFG